MEKNIKQFSDDELKQTGYNLFEIREQIMTQLQQINNSLQALRNERLQRDEKKKIVLKKEEKRVKK